MNERERSVFIGLLKETKTLSLYAASFVNHHLEPALFGRPDLTETSVSVLSLEKLREKAQQVLKETETMNQELKAGLRWGRCQVNGRRYGEKEWSRWVIVRITGKFPFLKAEVYFDPGPSYSPGSEASATFGSPELWQFGPELAIPSPDYQVVERAKDDGKI